MPYPYTLETIPENRLLMVRAELVLTPQSQNCLTQSAMDILDKYADFESRDRIVDELYGYFYEHASGLQRKSVRRVITPTITEDLSIQPGGCFILFRHLSESCSDSDVSNSKLVLTGQVFQLRTVLYSVVPVLWRLQNVVPGITVHAELTLLTLDNELIDFMNTELYPS